MGSCEHGIIQIVRQFVSNGGDCYEEDLQSCTQLVSKSVA
jgi:hypothetical protein